MRIGILTSWRVPCGIYQYSSRLAEAFARQPGVEPVILAGRADEHRSVPEEWDGEVHDVAKIGLWRDDQRYALDGLRILNEIPLDALHIQYQSMLFSQHDLRWLADDFPGPAAITFHDNCQAPDFPYQAFDLKFSHRWNVGPPDVEVLPFGIEERTPVVRSFGLGRTRSDYIQPICERHGWIYESAASHEPIQGGGQSWQSHESLIQWLRGADAIVLWYDDVGQAGSSQAARTALAARRPVIVNDVTWFEDMPPYTHQFKKVTDLDQLEVELLGTLYSRYIQENSWDNVAKLLLDRYSKAKVTA